MDKLFSWQNYNRMAKGLESIGYVVIVFGPLSGIFLLIFGDMMFRFIGIGVILASFLVSLYHLSFSLLMNGIRDLKMKLEAYEKSVAD